MDTKEDHVMPKSDFNRKYGNLSQADEVKIPIVDLKQTRSENSEEGVNVEITVTPILPLPTLLRPYVECTDEEGRHHGYAIPYVLLDIHHFFVGVPDEFWIQFNQDALFDSLWEVLSSCTRRFKVQKITEDSIFRSESEEFMLDIQGSVIPKIVDQDVEYIQKRLHSWIPQCCLKPSAEDKRNLLRVFIFLPPKYHILMKLQQQGKDSSKLIVVTDFWPCLPYLDSFLDKILESQDSL
eukprot:TRINITY_DN971_c1_g1_i13.p1 TRINITY_DN971_c1_g1~~TRINITY_DN971_c1_g1_i13.p1  ORF type:complete len:238 (-),score=19.18 TRINITY_DN971_c1_g1_i13:589-1302(-)